MKALVAATIGKVTTMRDRSVRVQVDTQELDDAQMTEVFKLYGKYGYFFFSENEGKPKLENLPDVPQFKEKGKSPSQRLREVLYRLWQQTTKQ